MLLFSLFVFRSCFWFLSWCPSLLSSSLFCLLMLPWSQKRFWFAFVLCTYTYSLLAFFCFLFFLFAAFFFVVSLLVLFLFYFSFSLLYLFLCYVCFFVISVSFFRSFSLLCLFLCGFCFFVVSVFQFLFLCGFCFIVFSVYLLFLFPFLCFFCFFAFFFIVVIGYSLLLNVLVSLPTFLCLKHIFLSCLHLPDIYCAGWFAGVRPYVRLNVWSYWGWKWLEKCKNKLLWLYVIGEIIFSFELWFQLFKYHFQNRLDNLTSAFGLLTLFRGFSSMIGPPINGEPVQFDQQSWILIPGWIFEGTNQYNISFFVSGGFLLLAGIISCVVDLLKRKRDRWRKKEEWKKKKSKCCQVAERRKQWWGSGQLKRLELDQ